MIFGNFLKGEHLFMLQYRVTPHPSTICLLDINVAFRARFLFLTWQSSYLVQQKYVNVHKEFQPKLFKHANKCWRTIQVFILTKIQSMAAYLWFIYHDPSQEWKHLFVMGQGACWGENNLTNYPSFYPNKKSKHGCIFMIYLPWSIPGVKAFVC